VPDIFEVPAGVGQRMADAPLAVLRPLRDTDPFAAQEPKLRRLTAGPRRQNLSELMINLTSILVMGI